MNLRQFKFLRQILRELLPARYSSRRFGLFDYLSMLRNLPLLHLNIKNMGYEIGRTMASRLAEIPVPESPGVFGLRSKPTTQADIEAPWFSYWCAQLRSAPIYHRKLWEFAYVLQVLRENGMIEAGKRGIGFGCGEEPLASYFASCGVDVLITDLDTSRATKMGWRDTGQHASSIEQAYRRDIVDRETFDRHARHRHVDMNRIPAFDEQYDFCWSVCAMEHLGSIAQGLDFVENSLAALKPGGIAVHTTEFNYLADSPTIDARSTVLFQRKHIADLAARLTAKGHYVFGPDFDVGSGVLDRFIDLPPYELDDGWMPRTLWGESNQRAHLKLAIAGYPCTCFGLIVRKADNC